MEPPTARVVGLHAIYWAVVLLSLISIREPYHLSVEVIFYVVNGLYMAMYIYTEATGTAKKLPVKAVSYYRHITITVVVALIFSVFSGYRSLSSAFSYNIKSHLFLFVPNSLLFMLSASFILYPGKAEDLRTHYFSDPPRMLQLIILLTLLYLLAYAAVVIIFFI